MNSFTSEPVGRPVVGMDFDEIGEIAAPIPSEYRDAFAQLATQGKLPGQDVELRFVPIHDLQRRRVTTFFCSPVFCVEDASLIYGYRAFQGIGLGADLLADAVRRCHGEGVSRAIRQSADSDRARGTRPGDPAWA